MLTYPMRLLIFNQYYPPDSGATAQWLSSLCKVLASTCQITIVCGYPSYNPIKKDASHIKGIRVIRVPSTTFHRSNMFGRLCNYFTYFISAFSLSSFLLFRKKPDLIVAMTDPPIIGLIAKYVATIKRVPFIYIIQDLHPESAIVIGKIKNRLIIKILKAITLFLCQKAEKVVVISLRMQQRLLEKGVPNEKIIIIPNWADTKSIAPEPKKNPFSLRHGLEKRFVVMYSGNLGLSQNLDILLELAKTLQDLKDLVFVIIGDGARKIELMDQVRKLNLANVLFFPYQSTSEMRYSFGTADLFIIPLVSGLDGLVVPSKVFSIMASGRPFIAFASKQSEVAQIAEKFECGLTVQPDDPKELADKIRWAYHSQDQLSILGQRGRTAVENHYKDEVAIARYHDLFFATTFKNSKVKILVVTQYFWPENFRINDLVKRLVEKGHEVTVLTGFPNYPYGRLFSNYKRTQPFLRESFQGAKIIRVWFYLNHSLSILKRLLNYGSFALSATLLGPFLCGRKFDRIFVFQPGPYSVAIPSLLFKFLSRSPATIWVQDIWPDALRDSEVVKQKWLLNLVEKLAGFLYRRFDKLLVSSPEFEKPLMRMGVEKSRIEFLPQWPEDLYQKKEADSILLEKENMKDFFNVVFAGNLGPAQNPELIIEVADQLKTFSDIHFVILGDGVSLESLRQEIKRRGLTNVDLKGRKPLEMMPQYFALADILLVQLKKAPIYRMTIPGKLQSYLACGRPIIAGLEGAGAEIIRQSGAGLVVEPGNVKALKEAILFLHSCSKETREEMGQKGLEFFKENFNPSKIMNQLEVSLT